MPVFSIITPSYNQLDWLRLCIASVRDQTLLPAPCSLEHIIQDAGTPGIEDLARELGAEFHRNGHLIFEANPSAIARPWNAQHIPPGSQTPSFAREGQSRLHRADIAHNAALKIFSEPDDGMYDAINKGLLKSTGEICSWLNCDEQYTPGALKNIQSAFKRPPDVHAVFGDFVVLDQSNNPLCYRRSFAQDQRNLTFSPLNIASCTLFFRRKVIDAGFLFDPDWKIIGDKVWIINLLEAGFQFKSTRRLVACFRLLTSNLSSRPLAIEEENRFSKQYQPMKKTQQIALKFRQFFMKFLLGCYLPRRVDFRIVGFNGEPVRIGPKWVGFLWPKST